MDPSEPRDDSDRAVEEQINAVFADLDPLDQLDFLQRLGAASFEQKLRDKRRLTLPAPPVQPERVQLRVDLVGAKPPIWRRLSLPGDLNLQQVHEALQAAFEWTNSHLHRFSPSDDRYGSHTEAIVTQYDIDEGEDGVLETEVQLSQLAHTVGGTFYYTYDFGDDWEHKLVVEATEPLDEPDRELRCIAGKNVAPPEDSGVMHGFEHHGSLGEFDQDSVNRALARLAGASETLGWLLESDSELAAIAERLGPEARLFLAGFVTDANLGEPVEVTEAQATRATAVFRILLTHIRGGVTLTAAGYLPPTVVTALAADFGVRPEFAGKKLREVDEWQVFELREVCVSLGLVRKYSGQLMLTRLGRSLRDKPVELWQHIAGRLPLERADLPGKIGALLLLLVAAGEAEPRAHLVESLDLLTAMIGVRVGGDRPHRRTLAIDVVEATDDVLSWVAEGTVHGFHFADAQGDSSAARLIARAALQHGMQP